MRRATPIGARESTRGRNSPKRCDESRAHKLTPRPQKCAYTRPVLFFFYKSIIRLIFDIRKNRSERRRKFRNVSFQRVENLTFWDISDCRLTRKKKEKTQWCLWICIITDNESIFFYVKERFFLIPFYVLRSTVSCNSRRTHVLATPRSWVKNILRVYSRRARPTLAQVVAQCWRIASARELL